jgi:hypothetical protein
MLNFFFSQTFPLLIFLKIGLLIFDLFFIVFLFIVLKQIISMNNLVSEVHDAFIFKTAAVINIIIALSLFLTAIAIL